jgi:hypothetical protein
MRYSYFQIILGTLLLCSCGQINREIAIDQIIGTYKGKATYIYKHSLQNVGLKDESKETKGQILIYRDSTGDIFIQTGEGNIKLSVLTLVSNGTIFNIPYQNIKQTDGTNSIFQGIQNAELEGAKYDGIYLSESNILKFGYETIIKYNYWGQKADLSVICAFEFAKNK